MASTRSHSIEYAQNFLRDGRLVDHLLDRSSIDAGDTFYEIGPGTGLITARLVRRCREVVAIEKDAVLAEKLRRRFAECGNLTIYTADFLPFPLPWTSYKVFANIPFNQTAAIVTKLTRASNPPRDAYLVVQSEAANRFIGSPALSLYAILLRPWFETVVVHRFERRDFMPPPAVDTTLLQIRKRGPPLVSDEDRQLYRDFVTYAFTAWRASVGDAIEGLLGRRRFRTLAREIGFSVCARPTSVTFDHWLALFHHFRSVADARARQAVAGAEQRLARQQHRLQKSHRTRRPPPSGMHLPAVWGQCRPLHDDTVDGATVARSRPRLAFRHPQAPQRPEPARMRCPLPPPAAAWS